MQNRLEAGWMDAAGHWRRVWYSRRVGGDDIAGGAGGASEDAHWALAWGDDTFCDADETFCDSDKWICGADKWFCGSDKSFVGAYAEFRV